MKSTGIVRNIDSLGRIVLPVEMRKLLEMNIGDPIEFFSEGDSIVLKKFQRSCIFCNTPEAKLIEFEGKKICTLCARRLGHAVETLD